MEELIVARGNRDGGRAAAALAAWRHERASLSVPPSGYAYIARGIVRRHPSDRLQGEVARVMIAVVLADMVGGMAIAAE